MCVTGAESIVFTIIGEIYHQLCHVILELVYESHSCHPKNEGPSVPEATL